MSVADELRLVLSGAAEQAILATLRRWPYWLRAEVERDPTDTSQCLSVTLITERSQEATLREILRRSFGLTFPAEGGSRTMIAPVVPEPRARGFGARRG